MFARVRLALFSLALGAAFFASRAALACPACAGNGRNLQLLKLGGLFMLLPFAVVALVVYVLRHAPEERAAEQSGLTKLGR